MSLFRLDQSWCIQVPFERQDPSELKWFLHIGPGSHIEQRSRLDHSPEAELDPGPQKRL